MTQRLTVHSCLLLLCACDAVASGADNPAAVGGKSSPMPPAARVQVQSTIVQDVQVPKTLTVTGTLQADQRTELSANALGRVVRTFVERGDHVRAGALLAQLDTRGAEISRAEAEAHARQTSEQVKAVRLECERYAALRDKGAITGQEYDRQASQCATQSSLEEAARARLADVARVLEDAAIRAPFAGVIGERLVSVGDYVQPSSKVAALLDDDPLRLRISVPEQAVPYAREGTRVTFKTLSADGTVLPATIKYVGRELRPATRDVITEALVDNHEHELLPGMFVTVQLPLGSAPQVVVPQSALVALDGGTTVFTINAGKVEQRVVRVTVPVEGGLAVSEGLQKGDRVVVSPPPDLRDGASVE